MKAIIEETEVQNAAAPSSPAQKFNPIHLEPAPRPVGQPKQQEEGYPSCLDLAAEFMGRG